MPSFCIGIPTHNRPDDLAVCLAALVPQIRNRSNVRLVVVNDGTHDERYERVIAPYRDALDYRAQAENRGSSATRAAAFAGAQEDYLICSDDDCQAPDDWLDNLEAIVETNPAVDLVAGAVKPVWIKPPTLGNRMLAAPASYPRPHFTEHGLLTAVTANCAFRRSAYEAVGGFHPDIKEAAADDFYLTQRLLRQGATGLHAENWVIGHKSHQTLGQIRRRFFSYGFGNAHLVHLLDSWEFVEVSSDGSLAGSVGQVARWVRHEWRDGAMSGKGMLIRIAHALVTLVIAFDYERGWNRGLRHFGGRNFSAGLPRRPAIEQRFVDFSDPAQRAMALGEASKR